MPDGNDSLYCFNFLTQREYGVSFLPAVSRSALKEIRKAVRLWALQCRSDKHLDDLARIFGPYIRGWINYYSHFYKSALYSTLRLIDDHLSRWAQRKFKHLRQRPKRARRGWPGWRDERQGSSPIGGFYMRTAGCREPYESRGSRTVL
jgi:Group II intron, maturase-specific domain